MKKITVFLIVISFLLSGVSVYADTSDNSWLYEGKDSIIRDYNIERGYSLGLSAEPSYALSNLKWISANKSGNGTGAVQFNLKNYAFESPSYNISLIDKRSYKISLDIKPEVDFVTDRFSFWISAQKKDGTGESVSNKMYIDGVDFKKGQWTSFEKYFNWDGKIDGYEVDSENVNIKFQIGSAGVSEFKEATGDNNIPISYSFDNFNISPFIPEFKAKVTGEHKSGETILLKCSYDYLYEDRYNEFKGFSGALVKVKADGETIKEETGKEISLKLVDGYIGKLISYEISPIVYGHQLETINITGEAVTRKENIHKLYFDNKLIAEGIDAITGRIKQEIYDETESKVYLATYKDGKLKEVINVEEADFEIETSDSDRVSAFIWDNGFLPLTEKKVIEKEENSVSIFVDPEKGDDNNTGEATSAFKTVKRAKQEVAKLLKKHGNHSNTRWNYEDTVLTISGKGQMADYEQGGAPWMVHGDDIRTLIIEDGVTDIGDNAFYGLSNVKNAIIPNTITKIGTNAFAGCEKLSAVVIPDSVVAVEDGAFDATTSACVSNTSPLKDIAGFKKYTDGAVGDAAINETGKTNISWAVYGGDTLVFSGSGKMINTHPDNTNLPWKEYNSSLKTAVVDYGITWITQGLLTSDGDNRYPLMETIIIADGVTQMRNNEVAGCPNLTRYDTSNKLTNVEHYVIQGTHITELYLPGTLTEAKDGNLDFNNLTKLEKLILGNGFNMITTDNSGEWGAFIREAGKLKSVTFPKSVTKVGAYSFARVSNLEKVEFLNPDTVISENAFWECSENITIYGYAGSTAEEFAKAKNYKFEEISNIVAEEEKTPDNLQGTAKGIEKIYVMLKSGEHFIDETLNFDYTDCSDEIDVEYTTYGEDKAVLTGGVKLDNDKWEMVDAQKGIYKNYVGKEIKTRQFFVDGVRANRARSNGGFTNCSVDSIGYLCDNSELLEYAHPEDLEILIHVAWTTPRCGVESVLEENGKVRVKMKPTAWDILWGRSQDSFQQCRPNNPYYYENAYELLDEEGEWYLNSHDGYLYYKPRAFEDLSVAEAVIPVTEKLVHIEGTKALEVHNICFDNIEFAYSTWMRPSTDAGHCSNQNNTIWDGDVNDMDNIYYPDGAVEVKCADNIDFKNCNFTKLGTIALKMHGGIHNCDIVGNEFYDLSAAALVVSERYGEAKTTDDDRYVNRDIKISNNLIHDTGIDFHDSAALTVGYVMDTQISNNEIFNTTYSGMHLGFVDNKNYISGLLIENNYVHDYMKKMTDGGGIYLFSNTAGSEEKPNIIRKNYVSHGWHGVAAYCIDYDVSNITFENNVNDSFNNSKNIDVYAKEWSSGWIPYDFSIGETNSNLNFINNYGTNGYKVNANSQNCTVSNHKMSEFGVWNNDVKAIIREAGVDDEFMYEMTEFPREIEIAERIEISAGDEVKIPFYAKTVSEGIYSGNIDTYCYSENEEIVSVKENNILVGRVSGETKVKVVFKCGTILRERVVTVAVK